jgi:hypothetical protein
MIMTEPLPYDTDHPDAPRSLDYSCWTCRAAIDEPCLVRGVRSPVEVRSWLDEKRYMEVLAAPYVEAHDWQKLAQLSHKTLIHSSRHTRAIRDFNLHNWHPETPW